MASPMVDGRVEPHRKAHYSLHISERVADSESSRGAFSSVKYNHKPALSAASRSTTVHESTANSCSLELRDTHDAGNDDVFTFTGQRTAPKKSYVLLFDQTTQTATLEPLSSTYTFNLASKNGKDVSAQHDKIYPKKAHKDSVHDREDDADLFGEQPGNNDTADPDPNNPYDFRHFLSKDKEKEKTADDSEHGFVSSPEYRTGTGTGTGSASDTPQRKPISTQPKPKPAVTAPKKRKTDPMVKKPTVKKPAPAPTVRLDRRATERPADTPKAKTKTAQPPASKIKSSELVHSSDDSDVDEAEKESVASPPPRRRTPTPPRHSYAHHSSDEDASGDESDGGLEIEVPDARPPRPRNTLGLGQNLGVGFLKSPSAGPRSLASAANSVDGSPAPGRHRQAMDEGVIDFGELGEEEDEEGDEEGADDGGYGRDGDVEPMNIGPPARQDSRKVSMGGGAGAAEEDEDDPLYKEMMEGLAGGDSSEESEEE